MKTRRRLSTLAFGIVFMWLALALSSTNLAMGQNLEEGKPDVVTIKVGTQITFAPGSYGRVLGLQSGANPTEQQAFDDQVADLINSTVGGGPPDGFVPQLDDYCIVHLVLWRGQKIEGDAWFLYKATGLGPPRWSRKTEQEGRRIYGHKRVAVLLVHLKIAPATEFDINYKVAINQKTPQPFKNIMTLIGVISPTGGAAVAEPIHVWGGKLVIVEKLPSDMVVSGNVAVSGEQTKEYTRTYDNEGRYRWDVSVGLPVKTFKELQFNSEGGRVTTSAKDRQNAYGFLNIFPVPVDTKGDAFLTIPHGIVGLPLASKPLHHPFVGIGTGVFKSPIKFNVFAGVTFHRERVPRTLGEGAIATPGQLEADLRTRWVRKFTWGINFPIGQIKDALK